MFNSNSFSLEAMTIMNHTVSLSRQSLSRKVGYQPRPIPGNIDSSRGIVNSNLSSIEASTPVFFNLRIWLDDHVTMHFHLGAVYWFDVFFSWWLNTIGFQNMSCNRLSMNSPATVQRPPCVYMVILPRVLSGRSVVLLKIQSILIDWVHDNCSLLVIASLIF